jgi:hypothetical protein
MCFDPIALHGDEFSVLLSFLFGKVRVDQSLVFLTVVCNVLGLEDFLTFGC